MSDNPNLPDYQHPKYREALSSLIFLEDMWAGRSNWYRYNNNNDIYNSEKAFCYLPPESEEPIEAYLSRLKRSRFERRFRNAIEKDFSGLLSQFVLKEAPRSLLQNQDNIDLRGNSLRVFLKEADKLALRDKYCFVFVEYPPFDQSIVSEADRLTAGRRPYLVLLTRSQVINWQVDYVNGKEVLTKLVFRKSIYRPDGEYGTTEIELFYVCLGGAYAAYEIVANGGQSIAKLAIDDRGQEIIGQTSLSYIPITIYSLTDTNVLETDVNSFPLQDLAEMNLELYQLESEKREILHKCNMPTLVIDRRNSEGYIPSDGMDFNRATTIGPNTIMYDCDVSWAEPTGRAIAATQEDIAKLNTRIDTQTLAFLSGSKTPRTATEAELDSSQMRSNYANMAIAKESAFNTLATIWGDYEGDYGNWAIECDRELFKSPLDIGVSEIQELYLTGVISINLCLSILRAKKVFGDNFTEQDLRLELERAGSIRLEEREEEEILA